MNRRDWKALAGVRGALHGWAFALPEWLPSMVRRAEEEKAQLPERLQAEAERLIAPVRAAIQR